MKKLLSLFASLIGSLTAIAMAVVSYFPITLGVSAGVVTSADSSGSTSIVNSISITSSNSMLVSRSSVIADAYYDNVGNLLGITNDCYSSDWYSANLTYPFVAQIYLDGTFGATWSYHGNQEFQGISSFTWANIPMNFSNLLASSDEPTIGAYYFYYACGFISWTSSTSWVWQTIYFNPFVGVTLNGYFASFSSRSVGSTMSAIGKWMNAGSYYRANTSNFSNFVISSVSGSSFSSIPTGIDQSSPFFGFRETGTTSLVPFAHEFELVYGSLDFHVNNHVYPDGFGDGYDSGYSVGNSEGYSVGNSDGYSHGFNDGTSNYGMWNLFSNAFGSVGNVLGITIFPGITVGLLISVPIALAFILWLIKILRG